MKSEVFNKELGYIQDENLRRFAKEMLDRLPDYFYTMAASTSGKYHPSYALGEGGLVRHTKAAVGIAKELFGNETVQEFNQKHKDIIVIALLLHDGIKSGFKQENYTTTMHPLDMSKFIMKQVDLYGHIDRMDMITLCRCIGSHMGQWNKDYKTQEEVLPKPVTNAEKFVHLCDYLASRKCLEFNFNI